MTDLQTVARWSGIPEGDLVAQNCHKGHGQVTAAAARTMAMIARSLAPLDAEPLPVAPSESPEIEPAPRRKRRYAKPGAHQQFVIAPSPRRKPDRNTVALAPRDTSEPADTSEAAALRRAADARRAIEDRRIARELGIM